MVSLSYGAAVMGFFEVKLERPECLSSFALELSTTLEALFVMLNHGTSLYVEPELFRLPAGLFGPSFLMVSRYSSSIGVNACGVFFLKVRQK